MKTSNLFLAAATMMFAFSCAPLEIDVEPTASADLSQAFYATIENAGGEDTKTTTNSSLYIYWNDNDELSIFNHGTHNSRYLYDYRPGWNSGVFLP